MELFEDVLDNQFSIHWKQDYESTMTFEAKEIIGEMDRKPLYECDDCSYTTNFNEAGRFIAGTIHWDSCSHLYFGDKDGYLHLCGVSDFKKLQLVLEYLYKRAFEIMQREPEDGEEW